MIDPDETALALTVLDLVEGCYVEQATVIGDEAISVQTPFPFTLSPADLILDLSER